jgi:hypothetical protein
MRMRNRDDVVVAVADVAEVMAAIEAVDLEAPWEEAAPHLRLALPRRRPFPPGTGDLPSQIYVPGIRAVLGLDIGPAMLFVRREQLASWGVSADHAFQRALVNVRQRVNHRRQFALVHERICGESTIAFQSREGWASTLLLLPDELSRILGERDGLIVAPMRDLVIWLPLDTDPALALFILEEFAAEDPNALDLPPYALVDGRLEDLPGHDVMFAGGMAMQ